MSQLIEIILRLIKTAQEQWGTLVKYVDGPTARTLIIVLTLLIVFEVMWFSMVVALHFILK